MNYYYTRVYKTIRESIYKYNAEACEIIEIFYQIQALEIFCEGAADLQDKLGPRIHQHKEVGLTWTCQDNVKWKMA